MTIHSINSFFKNMRDCYTSKPIYANTVQPQAFNDTSYKSGKNLSTDIDRSKKMLEAVQEKIQKLNLPATINAIAVNKDICRELYQAKQFIEKISKNYKKKEVAKHQLQFDELLRIVMSIKIGGLITPQMLADNPEYLKFIHKAKWHNAAIRYNHVLPVIEGKPGLLYENQSISYDDLIKKGWNPAHLIIKSGATFHWPYHFDKMIPHDHEDASKWGNQYAIEIMTSLKESPSSPGDHSWLRIKTPQGDVYSFGVYGPMQSRMENIRQRFGVSLNGCPDNPDRYETMDQNEIFFHGTTIAITKEQFDTLQTEILKLSQKGVPVGLLKSNCTGHVRRIVNKIGIQIESNCTIGKLGRIVFSKKVLFFYDKCIPRFIKSIFSVIGRFFQGLLLLTMRAGSRDKKTKEVWGDEFKSDFPNFMDKFKTALYKHPRALNEWQHKIDRWREKEISALSHKKIELINQKLELEKERSIDYDFKDKLTQFEAEVLAIDEKIKKVPFLLPII